MRLSSLFSATILLLSSVSLAQHAASAPAPSASHSAPSAPSHSTAPSSHVASAPSAHTASAPSHSSYAPIAHAAPSGNNRVESGDRIVGDQRITGEEKIASAPRIGEDPRKDTENKDTEKKTEKKSDPDLRRRVCLEGDCKKEPAPTEPDLRRRVCVGAQCTCPPGETAGKGGCAPASHQAVPCESGAAGCADTAIACPVNQVWNGTACAPIANRCAAGQIWNGASCGANCSIVTSQAQGLIMELRSARQNRDEACRLDPNGTSCQDSMGQYQVSLAEYQNLLGGAGSECRTRLPDPYSL